MSRGLWGCVLAAALLRLLVLPLNENLYGDAVVRTELALAWAEQPRWPRSASDGVHQFGPLHIALVGLASFLVPDKEWVGRVVSLVFGVATVPPLFLLTRRLFGEEAAVWAGLGFALWGLHLQLSTTAASEAAGLFTVVLGCALFARAQDTSSVWVLAGSGLCLTAACAIRYDSWLLVPLWVLILLAGLWPRSGLPRFGPTARTALTGALVFGAAASLFPLSWLTANAVYEGDMLAPVRMVESYHRQWIADGLRRHGEVGYRLQSLLFWPGVAAFTLTPLLAGLGAYGAARSFRERREHRWLLLLALLPAAYFTARAAVALSFVPLARFTVNQVVVLLPFAWAGFRALGEGRTLRRATWTLAVACPLLLGAFTYRAEGRLQDALRPVSPTSTNSRAVREAAALLRSSPGRVLLDEDPGYLDLQVAFFSGLDEDALLRVRWKEGGEAARVVTFEGGRVRPEPSWSVLYQRDRITLYDPQPAAGGRR